MIAALFVQRGGVYYGPQFRDVLLDIARSASPQLDASAP